jgi:hypothetical protein
MPSFQTHGLSTTIPSCLILLEKLIVVQISQGFPRLSWNRRFITRSQEPAIGPYPEPVQSSLHPQPQTLFLWHAFWYLTMSDHILPSTLKFSKQSLPFRFPDKNLYQLLTSLMLRPSNSHWFDYSNNILKIVQIADHSGRAVWGVGLCRLVAGIVGSNPAQGMDVCPRIFVLCCPV